MLETPRLRLRTFEARDQAPMARLCADPRVMEHFPSVLSAAETEALVARIDAHQAAHGFSFFAVERKSSGEFIGTAGLLRPRFSAHFTPCVEVGWRLFPHTWGEGLATEAARACVELGFGSLGLSQIVAMTTPGNLRSRRVMDKLGMTHDPAEDFDHPLLPVGHRLTRHVLYRLQRGS